MLPFLEYSARAAASTTDTVVIIGCCFAATLTVGFAGCIASKLNGLLSSFVGGSGDSGETSCSLSISGFKVGEGVISGVIVSSFMLGIGGAGL